MTYYLGLEPGGCQSRLRAAGLDDDLETVAGERCSGEVLSLTESELVLGNPGNYGVEERTLRIDEIGALAQDEGSDGHARGRLGTSLQRRRDG